VESKEAEIRCMKYWEITAANLGKAGFSWGCVQLWIAKSGQFGL
jgi:hypothetical protein